MTWLILKRKHCHFKAILSSLKKHLVCIDICLQFTLQTITQT